MASKGTDLRKVLLDSIQRVRAGAMGPAEATAISRLAGQINLSLQVEINARQEKLLISVDGTRLLPQQATAA